MNITTRKAEKSDIQTIAENISNMALEIADKEIAQHTSYKGAEFIMKNSELGFYIVAETQNENVGSLLILNEWSDWNNRMRWRIETVYVSPQYRQKGVYRAMYEFVKKQAQLSPEILELKLETDETNTKARKTYEKLGMHLSNKTTYASGHLK